MVVGGVGVEVQGGEKMRRSIRGWEKEKVKPAGQGQRNGKGRGQRAEGRGQRAEGRGQRAEGRGQRAEGRGQRAEGRGQRSESRGFMQLLVLFVRSWGKRELGSYDALGNL
jgi:hypothetical protein